jgi:hypothetical protein
MANATERSRIAAFEVRVAAIAATDIAWFSGWLCADGSIKPGPPPAIKFTICDRDPLERFSDLFGNRVHGPFKPSGLGKQVRYEWKLSGAKSLVLLRRCLPHLSRRYRERAEQAMRHSPRDHNGRKLSPSEIISIRAVLSSGRHGVGRMLARKYGVTDALISAIKHGRTWTECVST